MKVTKRPIFVRVLGTLFKNQEEHRMNKRKNETIDTITLLKSARLGLVWFGFMAYQPL